MGMMIPEFSQCCGSEFHIIYWCTGSDYLGLRLFTLAYQLECFIQYALRIGLQLSLPFPVSVTLDNAHKKFSASS